MREVADLAGVAMSSVSRVLAGHPDVSPAMRDRVMTAVERLGYQPDMLAQGLRSRSTRTVGFVIGDISNPLLASIVKGAETTLSAAGYSMLLTNSENDPQWDTRHVVLLEQRRVDGLLLSPASEDNEPLIEALRAVDGPIVVVDRDLPATVPASAVLSDHRSGMRDAVGHLLDLGHRRIGLVLGQPLRFSRERRRGLEDAYDDRRLAQTWTVAEGQLSPEHGRAATKDLLEERDPPTALVIGGNQLLVGALREIRARDLTIGRDISLISCDDIPVMTLSEPPIAVVRRDMQQLGHCAAELVLARLAGETETRRVLLPTEFIARASCASPR